MKSLPYFASVMYAGLLLSTLLFSCGTQLTGVETTNGIRVTASSHIITGIAPPNSQLYLCDSGFIPFINRGQALQTTTDPAGSFRIPLGIGAWSLTVMTPDGHVAGVMVDNIQPDSSSPEEIALTAGTPGAISGSVAAGAQDTLLVYITGMCHYRLITDTPTFSITNLPPGKYQINVATLTDAAADPLVVLYTRTVLVSAGATTTIDGFPAVQ